MNTFNMKQWLAANKVGPYAKIALNESHEGNDQWINQFHATLDKINIKPWQKNQILQIPSEQIISLYGDTTPQRALQEIIKKMFHAAREGREMNEREKEVYRNDAFEFELNGKYYLADIELSLDGNDLVVKVLDLYGTEGEEYEKITDPQEYRNVTSYLQTDRKIQDKMMKYSPFRSAGLGLFEDDLDLSDNPLAPKIFNRKFTDQSNEDILEEYNIIFKGEKYIGDLKVYYDVYHEPNGDPYIDNLDVELLNLYKKVGDEYVEERNGLLKAKIQELISSKDYGYKIANDIDIPDNYYDVDPNDTDLDDDSWMDEQASIGYVMKTKPSDPLDREPLEM